MDPAELSNLLKVLSDSISSKSRHEDIALPIFDPEKNDNGAEKWCSSIEELGADLGWSSLQKAAKAGKVLRGSALSWFESWEPETGRTWDNFRKDIIALYPKKRNLAEKNIKAALYNSDSANSYCEYAREKLKLLRNTEIAYKESELLEIVCGGIRDENIQLACLNSSIKTTSELITVLSSYVKQPKKRPIDIKNENNFSETNKMKRFKPNTDSKSVFSKKCFNCGKLGHIQKQCFYQSSNASPLEVKSLSSDLNKKELDKPDRPVNTCTYCKKAGHQEENCFFKQRRESVNDSKNL